MRSQDPLISFKASDSRFQSVSKNVILASFQHLRAPRAVGSRNDQNPLHHIGGYKGRKFALLFNQLDINVIQKQTLNMSLYNISVCKYLAGLARSEEW